MHWFYPAACVCTVSIVCVFVSISIVWVISRLPESYWAKSSALSFIAHRALCPKESNSYLLIILLEEGNAPCFSISKTEQTLALTSVLKYCVCRLDLSSAWEDANGFLHKLCACTHQLPALWMKEKSSLAIRLFWRTTAGGQRFNAGCVYCYCWGLCMGLLSALHLLNYVVLSRKDCALTLTRPYWVLSQKKTCDGFLLEFWS